MTTNLERYKTDLEKLIALGEKMLLDLRGRHLLEKGNVKPEKKKLLEELNGTFEREYQRWYTETSSLIRQLIPDRLAEAVPAGRSIIILVTVLAARYTG